MLEFDAASTLASSLRGPGDGSEWPDLEHGILVDGDHAWPGRRLSSRFG